MFESRHDQGDNDSHNNHQDQACGPYNNPEDFLLSVFEIVVLCQLLEEQNANSV